MPRRKRKPRSQTFVQTRKAALRRWGPHDTPGHIAMLLDQPTEYVHAAIAKDVQRVLRAYGKDTTARELAEELGLPIPFVNYCIRRVHAVALDRRNQPDREARRERMDAQTRQQSGGRLRVGVGAHPST